FVRSGNTWSLEQKLTAQDPAQNDFFGYDVAVSGSTVLVGAHVDDDRGADSGSAYLFVRVGTVWSQQAKLTASDGALGDNFGRTVALSDNFALVGARADDDHGDASGSAYVFVRTGTKWSQQTKLTAQDAAGGDAFGHTVSLSGSVALVGTPSDDSYTGSVYEFVRDGTTWTQRAKHTAPDAAEGDNFGHTVGISGEVAFVGAHGNDDAGSASGSAYVIEPVGPAVFVQQAKLTASDGAADDFFGYPVSVSGDTALMGTILDDDRATDSGAAYVFVRSGTAWSQQQKLTAPDGAQNAWLGNRLSVDGDTALIAPGQDHEAGANAGAAYVFARSGTTWSQQQKLTASDADFFQTLGSSVSLSGNTALLGSDGDDERGFRAGAAYVFVRSGTSWSEQQKLTASDGEEGDHMGYAVSLSGDMALVSAVADADRGTETGSAYVFVRSGTAWSEQQKLTASDGAAEDWFGVRVVLGGDTALIGAHNDDDRGDDSGSAYVFARSGMTWGEQQKLTASDGAADDYFGARVSLSGNTAVIGAKQDDDRGDNSGSAYVFMRRGTTWIEHQKHTAPDGEGGDQFGNALSVSGDVAFVSANRDHNDRGADAGSVYVFERLGELANTQPSVQIASPPNGTVFNQGEEVTLTGAASDTEDDNAVLTTKIVWSSSLDGTIGDPGGEVSSTSLSGGQHTIRADVTDSGGDTASDTVTVNVSTPPTVQITSPANGATFNEEASIGFAGTATEDASGTGADISGDLEWVYGTENPLGNGASFSSTELPGGPVTVTARVKDSGNWEGIQLEGSASINLTINQAPSVTIQTPADGATLIQNQSYSYQGSVVDDLDNGSTLTANLSWHSDADDATWGPGGNTNRALQALGQHQITASVTDSGGLVGTREINVTVINTAPSVNITAPPDGSTLTQNVPVAFSATATDIQNGNLSAGITWSSNQDGAFPVMAGKHAGLSGDKTHVITASATDQGSPGMTGSGSISVYVKNPPPTIGVIGLSRNRTQFITGEKVIFSATAEDPNGGPVGESIDVKADIVWTSSLMGDPLGTGGSASPTLPVGNHVIKANVTDRNGKAATEKTINVEILSPLSGNEPIVAENDVSDLLGVYEAPNGVTYTLTYDNHLLKIEIYSPQTGKTAVRGVVWVSTSPAKAAFIRPRPDPTDANLGVVIVLLEKDEATGGLWQRVYPQGLLGARPAPDNPERKVLFKLVGK
ncbi:hypothetical protein ACFL59_11065, partial [Planctomycetota bacterium]